MKIDYKELKKAVDYIEKHGDKDKVEIKVSGVGGAFGGITLVFQRLDAHSVEIKIFEDEKMFSRLTKSERF
jgi:hypothetical protein